MGVYAIQNKQRATTLFYQKGKKNNPKGNYSAMNKMNRRPGPFFILSEQFIFYQLTVTIS